MRISNVASALPDFALGAAYLITWIAPTTFGDRFVNHVMVVMLLEFIIVHSSALMGHVAISQTTKRARVKSLVGFGVFYTLLVSGSVLAFKVWWPLFAFWGLTANRLLGVLFGHGAEGRERDYLKRTWAAGALFYLLGIGVTTVFPVPRLGITPEVVRSLDLPGGGLWIDQPHRVVAFGFLYFTFWGLSELFEHRWAQSGIAAE